MLASQSLKHAHYIVSPSVLVHKPQKEMFVETLMTSSILLAYSQNEKRIKGARYASKFHP
jgi:hypothetical protein